MSDTKQRERAMSLLGNMGSWIRHSDDYQNHFGFDEDITEQSALDLIAWIGRQVDKAASLESRLSVVEAERDIARASATWLRSIDPGLTPGQKD